MAIKIVDDITYICIYICIKQMLLERVREQGLSMARELLAWTTSTVAQGIPSSQRATGFVESLRGIR